MTYFKRSAILLTAVFLFLSLTACVGNKPAPGADTNTSQASDASASTAEDTSSSTVKDTVTSPGEMNFKTDGRYISAKNGEHIIDIEKQGPVVMRYNGEEGDKIFDGLSDGDLIRISCTAIAESYPGEAEIFSLELIAKGTSADLNEDTLNQLRELGRIE